MSSSASAIFADIPAFPFSRGQAGFAASPPRRLAASAGGHREVGRAGWVYRIARWMTRKRRRERAGRAGIALFTHRRSASRSESRPGRSRADAMGDPAGTGSGGKSGPRGRLCRANCAGPKSTLALPTTFVEPVGEPASGSRRLPYDLPACCMPLPETPSRRAAARLRRSPRPRSSQ